MRKFFYVMAISTIGSLITNLVYTIPQTMPLWFALGFLIALCVLVVKTTRSQFAFQFGRKRWLITAGLVLAPLLVSLLVQFCGDANWAIGVDIAWPQALCKQNPWLAPLLPSHLAITQHQLARAVFVEGGAWMMVFIFWPRTK